MARHEGPIVSPYRTHAPNPHSGAPVWQQRALNEAVVHQQPQAVVDDLPEEYRKSYKAKLPDGLQYAWRIQECLANADTVNALNLKLLSVDSDIEPVVYPGELVLAQFGYDTACKLQAYIALPGGLLQPIPATEVVVGDGWVLVIRATISALIALSLRHRVLQGLAMAMLVLDNLEDTALKNKAKRIFTDIRAACAGTDIAQIRNDKDRLKYIRDEYEKWSQQVSHKLKIDRDEHFADLLTTLLEQDGVIPEALETLELTQSLKSLQASVDTLSTLVYEQPSKDDVPAVKKLQGVIKTLSDKLDSHEDIVKQSLGLQEQLRRIDAPIAKTNNKEDHGLARQMDIDTLQSIGKLLNSG